MSELKFMANEPKEIIGNMGDEKVYTVKQAAEKVGVTYYSIMGHINKGHLPAYKMTKCNRYAIFESDLQQFIENGYERRPSNRRIKIKAEPAVAFSHAKYYTPISLAKAYSIKESDIYNRLHDGRVKGCKIKGDKWVIDEVETKKMLKELGVE